MSSLLYELGSYGPLILLVLSWWLLWDQKTLFFYYTLGIFVNSLLNSILKGIIQEPRPMYDAKKMQLLKDNVPDHFYRHGIPFDNFGMPSGHAQSALFSTTFVYFALRETKWLYVYVPMTFLTAVQRVQLNYHTLSQVLVGAITGYSFAYFVYTFAKEKIKNRIREKMDDDCHV